MDTMFAVIDSREEQWLAATDQRDEKMKLLEKSLHTISKCLETLQLERSTPLGEDSHSVKLDVGIEEGQRCNQLFIMRSVKVDFPRFEDSEVLNWIFKVEQFFSYYRVSGPYCLEIASIHFVGPVVPWFQMLQKAGTMTTWSALVQALQEDYGPNAFESPEYSLFKLTQEGTIT